MYEAQYKYISKNKEKYAGYARKYYHKVKNNPGYKERVKEYYLQNKDKILNSNKLKKRENKLKAIKYLGGQCKNCHGEFHPAIYEFHHTDPLTKDRDPSKVLGLSWKRIQEELDKCELLCANCHRLVHHNWESKNVEK